MSYNSFQFIFKKIALLSRELDQLGLHSHSNEIDSFLRKLAGPQQPQPVEFDAVSVYGEVLPPYKGSGYVALPSLVGDRPVYIVSGGDLDKVIKEKGLGKSLLSSTALARKQISEITDPLIIKHMKKVLSDISRDPNTINYTGSASVLVPVGDGLRLVLGVSLGKDSQGRDIPLLVTSSGGYRPGGYDDKFKRKSSFISSKEEREKTWVSESGTWGSPNWNGGHYTKPSVYVSISPEDNLFKNYYNTTGLSPNMLRVFGNIGNDGGQHGLEISRSAIKDPFAGISNPGKEALEMRTQASLKVYPANLSFGSTPPGEPITTTLTLYSVGFVPVKIDSIESDNPEVFTVFQLENSTLEPGGRTKLTVTFSTSLPYGDKNGTITIKSNSKDGDLVVPITASVERPALPPRQTGIVDFKMGIRKSTRLRIPIISNDNYLKLDRVKPYLARRVDSFDSLSEDEQEDLLDSISKEFEVDIPDTDTLEEKFRKARGIYD